MTKLFIEILFLFYSLKNLLTVFTGKDLADRIASFVTFLIYFWLFYYIRMNLRIVESFDIEMSI